MNQFRRFIASLTCVVAMLCPAVAPAVDVDDAKWGFDGRILTSEFNLLSVLVSNPTDTPFDGVLTVTHASSGGSPTGARLVERIYLANHSSRWVQFYPYCSSTADVWTVRWGNGQSFKVPDPRLGTEEPVLLDEANSFSSAGRGIKHFNEELFPPSVSATHTLKRIVIDRVPRWEAPRRQAFMDWLRLGGTVHLLKGDDGKFPDFSNQLSQLNSPLAFQRIGAGVVFRHELSREQINAESLATMESTRKRFIESLSGGADDPEVTKAINVVRPMETKKWDEVHGLWESDNQLFSVMKKLTRPNHNWALIYLLSFIYIGLIFPGCFLLGRRRVHYLVTYGAIIGCVALFSLIFLIVGRRGYGESTRINTLGFAQQIEGDNWDVSLFSNVFATAGDTYELKHQGEGGLYSTCSTMESVNGDIDSGVDGRFSVDIPPFSNRPFAHRMKIRLPQLPITKTAFEATDRLSRLELEVGESFPKDPIAMFVQFRHSFHMVTRQGNQLHAQPTRLEYKSFLKLSDYGSFFGAGTGGWLFGEDPEEAKEEFRDLWRALVARHLSILEDRSVQSFSLPTDRARLFVFTEAPDQLRVDSDRFPEQSGLLLYAVDILRNEINGN